jgi:hypothetical protein
MANYDYMIDATSEELDKVKSGVIQNPASPRLDRVGPATQLR